MIAKPTSLPTSTSDSPALAAIRKAHGAGYASASSLGSIWVEAVNDLGVELLEFVAERVKEDVQVQHQIMHAKSLAAVQHIQAEFLQKAVDQYSAETGKWVEFGKAALAELPGASLIPD